MHGRTRTCGYTGAVDYHTIGEIKAAIGIPVIANGDIRGAAQARAVLAATGANAVMIGRGAQGNPWIFREINHHLATGDFLPPPAFDEIGRTLIGHVRALHEFYGEPEGVRVARKHLGWYVRNLAGGDSFWRSINQVETAAVQIDLAGNYFCGVGARLAA